MYLLFSFHFHCFPPFNYLCYLFIGIFLSLHIPLLYHCILLALSLFRKHLSPGRLPPIITLAAFSINSNDHFISNVISQALSDTLGNKKEMCWTFFILWLLLLLFYDYVSSSIVRLKFILKLIVPHFYTCLFLSEARRRWWWSTSGGPLLSIMCDKFVSSR